jgi:hypothetical protein
VWWLLSVIPATREVEAGGWRVHPVLKTKYRPGGSWLTSEILDILEAEIRRIVVQSQPVQIGFFFLVLGFELS